MAFLATTALSEFWDPEQEILFLGAWCLRYDRRAEWESLRYRVLPYRWDNHEHFNDAVQYLDRCYERMLDWLVEYLNAVHHVSHDQRYWRILIGPWLMRYLHPLHDRYVHLLDALAEDADLNTTVLSSDCYEVPADTLRLSRAIIEDRYNLQLCSQILFLLGYAFPARAYSRKTHEIEPAKVSWAKGSPAKALARRTVESGSQAIVKLGVGRSKVALCQMYLPQNLLWKLVLKSNFSLLPIDRESSQLDSPAVFNESRRGLAALSHEDEFEKIAVRILPYNLPTIYLEGYTRAREDALARLRGFPQVIASAVGQTFDERFKFLAAEATERHKSLIISQHGGGYGILKHFPVENFEAKVADRYYVWGWAEKGNKKLRNVPNPKLSELDRLRKKPTGNTGKSKLGSVLFVATDHPKYLYCFHSTPVGSQWEDYFLWQIRFIQALTPPARQELVLRLSPDDFGNAVRQRLETRFGSLKYDEERRYYDSLRAARLVVVDHPMTTFLEALRFGVPTILFWDRERWEIRAEAEPHIDGLRKVGILWDSPEAAAAKVADVYDDPRKWWAQPAVQEVLKTFVDRYAFADKDWVNCWTRILDEEIALRQAGEN